MPEEYRAMTNPVEKTAHLHLNTGAMKKDCAQICEASFDVVKRAVKAMGKGTKKFDCIFNPTCTQDTILLRKRRGQVTYAEQIEHPILHQTHRFSLSLASNNNGTRKN
ncbi:hypothetical protein BLNAU_19499 [Blattamonas nauphoetae]|uniref:Uncharacterized protein n=1 Tax=Blattamonas nauphoetae TaxID=2049346 RepID=A0ABQ9X1D8_9EUKA|nr:hypothetical protein BLNAU_19499 [Blattamonas nauphoetae]